MNITMIRIHKMLNLWNKRTEKIWNNISHEIWSWRSLGPKSGHPQGQNHLTPKRSSTPGARRQHLRSNFEVLKQIWGERMTYDDIMGWNQTCVYNIIIFVCIYIYERQYDLGLVHGPHLIIMSMRKWDFKQPVFRQNPWRTNMNLWNQDKCNKKWRMNQSQHAGLKLTCTNVYMNFRVTPAW